MTHFIELNKVRAGQYASGSQWDGDDITNNTDDPTEAQAQQAQATVPAQLTDPVTLQVEAIRCFYKRRENRGPGTRITFTDGNGFAVSESYDEVKAKVAAAFA